MADESGYLLSKDAMERVAETVRIVEAMPGGRVPRPAQAIARGRNIQPIRVTSTTTVSGRYPGALLIHDVSAGTFTASTAIWIVPGEGQSLVEGDYDGYACGEAGPTGDSRMTFKTFNQEMTPITFVTDIVAILGGTVNGGTWP